MATDNSDSRGGRKASGTSTYLKALKVPAVFLLVGVGFIAAYYSLYVRNSLEYLKGRDLRLLSTIGSQIQSSLDNHETVLSSFSNYSYHHGQGFAEQFHCIVDVKAREFVPMFAYVSPDLPSGNNQRRPDCVEILQPDPRGTPPVVRARFIDDAGTAWTRSGSTSPPASVVHFRVELSPLLAPIFTRQVGDAAFDSLIIVTPSGRVIYSDVASELRLTSLDGILSRQPDGAWKEQSFAGLGRASQVLDVQLSGAEYVLYLQPCCTNISEDVPQIEKEPGWVVAGLTESSKLRNDSLAISFSVMALSGGLILLAIFSWPFLRLTLIGQEQRLRLIDVLAVGICSLLGIALVTLFLADWYSYDRLKEDLDGQLKQLVEDIKHNVGDEISSAYDQIRFLEDWTGGRKLPKQIPNFFSTTGLDSKVAAYPFFDYFSLIDTDGMQQSKLATAGFTTPLVPTYSREYFRHWEHRVLPEQTPLPAQPNVLVNNAYSHTFLESIRSATTGRKQAVLSTKAGTDTGTISVAALTISMLSLNNVVLPPGFKFAVIDNETVCSAFHGVSHPHCSFPACSHRLSMHR
jgi:hypothetical protein